LRTGIGRKRADRAFLVGDLLVDEDAAEATLRTLAARAVQPVLLHVLGTEDLRPTLEGPARLVDAESGQELDVGGGAPARAAYAEALQGWLAELRARCARWGVRYVPAFTD